MRIGYIAGSLLALSALSGYAQEMDTMTNISLSEVVVHETARRMRTKSTPLSIEVVNSASLRKHFTGNLMQSLEHVPGIQSMDIGSGFSKPMIRGLGFNRVTVTENGIKQEGQQWGADHGLEIDAFHVEQVMVHKGPSSLLYGSDAMGGVIEISQLPPPPENQVFGEAVLLGKSVNGAIGGSVMAGFKKDRWYAKLRFTEQHFGDYRVPTDTVIYLTQKMPISNRRLKNTAGYERDVNFYTEYRHYRYLSQYAVSNTYQKTGFFPGAHGIPDASRLEDDGSTRNIELPNSTVNHFKASTLQQYMWDGYTLQWRVGYQNNRRKEWSLFHTHYGNQASPETDPDKELDFNLNTYNSGIKLRMTGTENWEHTAGWDIQYQQNTISGYSFLLPEYNRFMNGLLWVSTYRPNENWSLSGGLRYDYGKLNISSFEDIYLRNYLYEQGYSTEVIENYQWRSYGVERHFQDVSGSLGVIWYPRHGHQVKLNIGRSFRLPGANELAANGVHHGTFRHEQGDGDLGSESGWQLDMAYSYEHDGWVVNISPFASWFSNYIFLKPTAEWSILPHAGQIYRYAGAEATFAGLEIDLQTPSWRGFNYRFGGEYVHTYNRDEKIPLSFSPPATMRHTLAWERDGVRIHAEWQGIASQNRIARNEDPTPGAHLLHAGLSLNIPIAQTRAEVTLSAHNLLNKKYYNHLSFYRKVEIPEPGRNIQILIKVPFKSSIK